jgi:hypothetical protein
MSATIDYGKLRASGQSVWRYTLIGGGFVWRHTGAFIKSAFRFLCGAALSVVGALLIFVAFPIQILTDSEILMHLTIFDEIHAARVYLLVLSMGGVSSLLVGLLILRGWWVSVYLQNDK